MANEEFKSHKIENYVTARQRDVCGEGFGDELLDLFLELDDFTLRCNLSLSDSFLFTGVASSLIDSASDFDFNVKLEYVQVFRWVDNIKR